MPCIIIAVSDALSISSPGINIVVVFLPWKTPNSPVAGLNKASLLPVSGLSKPSLTIAKVGSVIARLGPLNAPVPLANFLGIFLIVSPLPPKA